MRPESSFLARPMDALGSRCREHVLPLLSAVLSLALLLYYMTRLMMLPETRESLNDAVTKGTLLLTAVSLRLLREKKPAELRLLLQSACWVILSRIILGQLDWTLDSENYWAVMFFCVFAVGVTLRGKTRDRYFTVVTVAVCALLTLWAVAAVITAVRGSTVPDAPAWLSGVSMKAQKSLVYVVLYDQHRNTSAIFFLPAMCMMLYQCVRHRHWGWYAAAGITIPLWFTVIALQHCRSAYLATAASLALLIGHLAMRRIEKRSRLGAAAAAVVVTMALTVLLYTLFPACSNVIGGISRRYNASAAVKTEETVPAESTDPAETEEGSVPAPGAEPASAPEEEAEETVPAEETDPGAAAAEGETETSVMTVSDSRNTVRDAFTLTGRTVIWKYAKWRITKTKDTMLYGHQVKTMMKPISKRLGWKVSHTHNILVQQTMMAGLPGGLLYLLLLLSLTVRIVQCYFRQKGRGRAETLLLALALTGIMIYGMFEPLLSQNKPILSLIFCLLGGWFVGELEEDGGKYGPDSAKP